MKANELRIGNRFIREKGTGREVEYDHNFILNETAMAALFGQDKNLALQDLFPIPLTPEILEKCGFTTDEMKCEYRIGLPIGEGEDLFIEDEGHPSMSCGIKDEKHFNYFNDIRYLHQLQNLFWCLCGKELDVKL